MRDLLHLIVIVIISLWPNDLYCLSKLQTEIGMKVQIAMSLSKVFGIIIHQTGNYNV